MKENENKTRDSKKLQKVEVLTARLLLMFSTSSLGFWNELEQF